MITYLRGLIFIIKRDGKKEAFSLDKIKNAISKAFLSVGSFATQDVITNVLSRVSISDGTNVEEIQNQVEVALMAEHYYSVAKAYMLYRQKHLEDREVRDKLKFLMDYCDASNPASGSKYDANANVENKNIDTQDLPNIIVIMDEAFSDLKVLGPLETNEDYMPFMHRMQQGEKNTVTGYVQTSVCGGNTADSEFEFLTGNTMAFLPNGSIPYQQYIKGRTPSLAGYLKSLGYATYAQHPYQASGWNRDKVYPLLGFDNLDFMEDYRDVSYVRNYISDASDMEHIIETYEKNKASGKPAFIFNVTMQNHGGYTDTYMNLTNDIQSQYASEPLNQYLTLIHKTDQALENLIDYFSKVDDRTIIVFFGDHQPNDTVASVVENGAQVETQKRYLVPYLVWSNYGIEGAKDKNTSLNYLAAQVLTAAGVPTNAYQNYLLSLSKTYPVISEAGQTKGIGADEKQLQTYKKLQYYQLFEKNKEKDE